MEEIILALTQEEYWTLSRQQNGDPAEGEAFCGERTSNEAGRIPPGRAVEQSGVCEDDAEGYASSKARLYRDWAVEMPTETQRDTARRMADEMEAEYVAAMALRDKLYRAAAVVGRKEEETE